MLLFNVAILMVLAMAASAYRWNSWTSWIDQEECRVLCGGGYKLQQRTRSCQSGSCSGDSLQQRNETCNTQSCGDKCPEGIKTFIPHATNIQRFYQCANGRAWLNRCPSVTVWNQRLTLCVWA
ncbi:endochitinase-like [Gigantopelta aegis]|uniref:endochitinase-like n=1 Tax=Gigantopelta aegis TaxID=1735272 RepID=UPI001B88BEA2|nr:endochitinase-like [Gigantopelta aegis]